MAQVVGSRLSRLAMRAGTAVGAAGLAAVALTPVGAPQAAALTIPYAYVANAAAPGTVSVINTSTNTVVKTVGVGSAPDAVAITPNGSDAYVADCRFQHRERDQHLHQSSGEDGAGRRQPRRGRHHPQRELRLRGQRRLQDRERHQHLYQQGGEDGGSRFRASRGCHHPQRERTSM